MQATEITEQFLLHLDKDHDRSEGLHVSEIIRTIAIKTGKLKADDLEEIGEVPRFKAGLPHTLRILLGLAWELYLAIAHPWIYFHGGEVRLDGISGSPDGDSRVKGVQRIHEFKLTWKSDSKHAVEDHWYWLAQIKAYLKMAASTDNIAILHVYFVNGNYKGSGPRYKVWQLQFTQAEIDNNWTMIIQEAWDQFKHDPAEHKGRKSGVCPVKR